MNATMSDQLKYYFSANPKAMWWDPFKVKIQTDHFKEMKSRYQHFKKDADTKRVIVADAMKFLNCSKNRAVYYLNKR